MEENKVLKKRNPSDRQTTPHIPKVKKQSNGVPRSTANNLVSNGLNSSQKNNDRSPAEMLQVLQMLALNQISFDSSTSKM